jgi:valyl-tRNA synthetase
LSHVLRPEPSLAQPYDPGLVEPRWYSFWEEHGVFATSDGAADKRPVYVVPMPPPNVTGSLHMGHALMTTLQDVLVRWHRMRGYNALWQPGTDHAGIATQTVVERMLVREGTSRQSIGREAFVERVWNWRRETGDRIHLQQRVLGASPDWSRAKFTMDADMSRAVTEAFVRLHEQGLMYRATRLINWCPECLTALSDLEVENEEGANGELFEFAYEVEGGGEIVVATTRPETMLGDTAVAVHPDDPRYRALHGKRVRHPFVDRTFPIITDAILVDPKFGTGAVKVTPAHDFNDFATGKRHGLEEINILSLDGTMNAHAGPFANMDRKEARRAVKKELAERGLARGAKPHVLTLPRCQRSGGVVEPMISTQWFLKMKAMSDAALDAVRSAKTVIIPGEWQKTYDHFLENILDWCVSRQLWWGHQIPAWHGPNGEIRVARERPAECGEGWKQDPDVLDTWFSSALWPFSTLGWPEKTPALAKFYPASDLETGYDILFFWVARMMMFGLHFMGEAPFRRILLHGLVVDETGEKMSKVKGNVIDPLDLVNGTTFAEMVKKTLPGAPAEEALAKFKKAYPSAAAMGGGFPAFGADAVRFTLATYPPSNKRIALAPKRIEGNRHFLNKIWNATRLSLELLGDFAWPETSGSPKGFYNRWIRSRFAAACGTAHDGLAEFRIDEAAQAGYRFFWNDFCDWYLELVKPVLRATADGTFPRPDLVPETRETLAYVLEGSLRLMHPLMPYITEELWQRVPRPRSSTVSIAWAPFPTKDAESAARNEDIDSRMDLLQDVVSAGRMTRSEYGVENKALVPLHVRSDRPEVLAFLQEHADAMRVLVRTRGEPRFEAPGDRLPGFARWLIATPHGMLEVLIGLKGIVTGEEERSRIEKRKKQVEKEVSALSKKLAAPGFVDRAPPEVVTETQTALVVNRELLAKLEEWLLLAKTYELVMSSGDDLFIRNVTATGAKIAGRMLHISGPDAVKLSVVVGAGTGEIEGTALRDGKPQSGAMILLVPQDPENNLPLFRRDQSDSDGSFTLSPVLPGRYTLLALENGWELQWGDAAALKPFLVNGEAIVVDAKGNHNMRVKVQ